MYFKSTYRSKFHNLKAKKEGVGGWIVKNYDKVPIITNKLF